MQITQYNRKLGRAITGELKTVCRERLEAVGQYENFLVSLSKVERRQGFSFLLYQDLTRMAEACNCKALDLLTEANPLAAQAVPDMELLTKLNALDDTTLEHLLPYTKIMMNFCLDSADFDSEGEPMLSPSLRAKANFLIFSTLGNPINVEYEKKASSEGKDEAAQKRNLLKSKLIDNLVLDSNEIVDFAFYFQMPLRWLFVTPPDYSFWGFKPTAEQLSDLLQLCSAEKRNFILNVAFPEGKDD